MFQPHSLFKKEDNSPGDYPMFDKTHIYQCALYWIDNNQDASIPVDFGIDISCSSRIIVEKWFSGCQNPPFRFLENTRILGNHHGLVETRKLQWLPSGKQT